MIKTIAQTLFLSFLFIGCAENIESQNDDDNNNVANNEKGNNETKKGTHITNTKKGDITLSTIDATSEENWIYLHLGSGLEVSPEKPDESPDWDLAFQRFKIKSNGGISGNGGVEIAALPGTQFDQLTQAPMTGYLVDEVDSDDDDQDPDFVLLAQSWYDYDPVNHTLTANDNVYVVHGVDDQYYKIQFLNYYDDAGTPGLPTLRWGKIDAPSTEPVEGLVLETEAETWTYIDVTKGQIVNVTGPSATIWDVAFSETKIRTNSGTTAQGIAGAKVSENKWEDLNSSSTIGFQVDEMLPLPGPPGSGKFSGNLPLNNWYDYDAQNHIVSPKKNMTFLVRSNNGEYAKLRIKNYENGVYLIETKVVERKVDVFTNILDAKDEKKYFSFRRGELVTITDIDTDLTWDIAVNGTKIQTNGGTSGSGKGSAAITKATALADINMVPGNACYLPAEGHICDCELDINACSERTGIWTEKCDKCPDGFEEDIILVDPTPDSNNFSGNPILNEWYNYAPETHDISSKRLTYVVKTANEGFAKIKIQNYDDGTMTIDWAFTGAGRRDF